MRAWERTGALAAFAQAAVFVALVVLFIPGGVIGPVTTDPSALRIAPALAATSLLTATHGVWLALIALTVHYRLRAVAPGLTALATASGLAAAALFLTVGMVGTGITTIAASPDQASAASAFLALAAVRVGLLDAARTAVGAWRILLSVAALRSGALPKGLNYLGIVAGAGEIIAFLVPELGLPVLPLVWNAWFGVVLLRSPRAEPVAVPSA